jgi:hypothetical protein
MIAGMTRECGLLWAHSGASTVAAGCAGSCTADPFTGLSELNGPAPTCAWADCLACPADFNGLFFQMSGFTMSGSGMTERTARPCSEFTRVVHDPCVGAIETISPMPTTTASPTVAEPAASSSSSISATTTPFVLVASSPHGLLMTVLLVLLA